MCNVASHCSHVGTCGYKLITSGKTTKSEKEGSVYEREREEGSQADEEEEKETRKQR